MNKFIIILKTFIKVRLRGRRNQYLVENYTPEKNGGLALPGRSHDYRETHSPSTKKRPSRSLAWPERQSSSPSLASSRVRLEVPHCPAPPSVASKLRLWSMMVHMVSFFTTRPDDEVRTTHATKTSTGGFCLRVVQRFTRATHREDRIFLAERHTPSASGKYINSRRPEHTTQEHPLRSY